MSYTRAEIPVYSRKERAAPRRVDPVVSQPDGKSVSGSRPSVAEIVSAGKPVLVAVFFASILLPISVSLGPIYMMPYRAVLLVLFLPLFFRLVSGKMGGILLCDWLMAGATLWITLALAMNHPFGAIIEPAGVEMVEFFGAYALGRVAIRSAQDFSKMTKVYVGIVFVLLPFAIVEAVSHRAVLLDLIPGSINSSGASPRWGMRRVQTVFPHSIHYGTFVAIALGVAWFVMRPQAGLFFRIVMAFLVSLATFLSFSSGALAALMAQLVFLAYDVITKGRNRRWALFGWSVLVLYVLADFMAEKSVFHTIVFKATFSSGSAYNRILIFEHGMNNVWANPIFGLGNNDWVRPGWLGDSVDNFWLVMALRYGIPEFLMLGGAVGFIVYKAIRTKLTDPVDRACRAGFLVSIVGLIVAGGTVHYWKAIQAFALFFIGSGVWIFAGGAQRATVSQDEPDPAGGRRRPSRAQTSRSSP